MSTRLLTTLALFLTLASQAQSAPVNDGRFVETTVGAIKAFAQERKLDIDQLSWDFIGFQSLIGEDAAVDVFSRFNAYDAWIDTYSCRDHGPEIRCDKTGGIPRCFYAPDTGRFSIADLITSIGLSVAQIPEVGLGTTGLKSIKIWQSGKIIFAKIANSNGGEPAKTNQFACAKLELGLTCVRFDQAENEP